MEKQTLKEIFEKEIGKITDQIAKKYRPSKIILFGSCAKGAFTENSDIDMLIIKETSDSRIKRIKEVLLSVDNDLPFEPLVYTPLEIENRIKLGDFFVKTALKEGKVIYGN